ncbi:hypothetical protein OAT35_01725 [Candidatus Pelagibacter sp.]|nr:hypothetical protein [Candidatus Pelagibacter sp.]
MKKNIDPNKVSNFKNYEPSYHKYSSFCMKTKPNKRYFNGEVKRLTQEMRNDLCTEELKQKDPALYFSILGKKMPKKYLKLYETKAEVKEAKVPVSTEIKKDQVEETSKDNELLEYQKKRDRERAEQLEKDRKKDNQIIFNVVEPIRKDPNRGMRFVNCSEPINKGRLGHSKAFLYKANKTYKYYD